MAPEFEERISATMPAATRRAVAINYHFVRASSSGRFQLRAHERPARFAEQLAALAGNFTFLACRDLYDESRDASAPGVLITFDDGAKDVSEVALPLLRNCDATATVLVCSKPYLEGKLLQVHKVEYLMSALGLDGFQRAFYAELERRFPGGVEREPLDFAGGYRFYRYDDEPIRRFKLDLNYQLPFAYVAAVLDAIFEAVFGPGSEAEAIRETYMSLDDLKRLLDAGFEVGTHTHSHKVLPRLDFLEQKQEMETSVSFLKEITGESRISLAYPFGFHNDETDRAAEELDLLAGLAAERRPITKDDVQGRWAIPRYDVNDCFDLSTNEPKPTVLGD
jgi:peptidoglycan/xylan/chitin deacetylase (PgdA/CDA1 family)